MKYDLHIRVDQSRLAELISVITPSATIVVCKPTCDDTDEPKRVHYTNGKRNKGISAVQLAIEILSSRKSCTLESICKLFEERGFSPNSASPALAYLTKQGHVVNLHRGVYELVRTQS